MFARLGKIAYRRPYLILSLWLVLFVCTIPAFFALPGELVGGGFSSDNTESAHAQRVLQRELPSFTASNLLVVFQHDELSARDPEFQRQASAAVEAVIEHPEVLGVQSFTNAPGQISEDGHTAYTSIQFDVPAEDAQDLMPEIRDRMRDVDLTVRLSGAPAFYADIENTSERDLRRAELVAIPVALAALLFVFRGLVAAGTPLVAGAMSVAASLGLLYVVAQGFDLTIFVLNLATLLGLGLATD